VSKPALTVTWYRRATRLYPRRFREAYGPDLVQLFTDQLRDEAAWRVLIRSAVDLAITVPTRHLEAHMNRSPTPLVPVLFGALALSSVIVGLVVGSPIVLLLCLAVGVSAGALGLIAARGNRGLTEPHPTTAHWWKALVAGGGLLAALIAATTATGELPDGGWLIAMVIGLTSIVLLGAGVVLGIAHLASRPTRRATT
jgi:hypothetical protein